MELQILRARQLKIRERASWLWTLIRARISRSTLNAKIAQSAVAQSDQYDYCFWMYRIPEAFWRPRWLGFHSKFSIISLRRSIYGHTYAFHSITESAMLVHVELRRVLCPMLVIRFIVLLFLRPLLSHTLFLTCMLPIW